MFDLRYCNEEINNDINNSLTFQNNFKITPDMEIEFYHKDCILKKNQFNY